MNFFDLCAACGRGIGRGCQACWRVFARMLRLTYRYWWIILTVVALAVAWALIYSREDNQMFKVNAVAFLNGPSVMQFEQAYAPINGGNISPDAPLLNYITDKKIGHVTFFRVIDGLNDEVADYVDFDRKSVSTDTMLVQMQDRVSLQFTIKQRDLALVPEVERDLLAYLNSNDIMQQAYDRYIVNLREEVAFNHRQAHKLDSLTSHYYFRGHLGTDSFGQMKEGTVVMSDWGGDWKVKIFLEEIYKQQQHMQRGDIRLQLATAPVTLENHFSVFPIPVNGRMKCLVLFVLLGWIIACLIAQIVDKRKEFIAWLQQ